MHENTNTINTSQVRPATEHPGFQVMQKMQQPGCMPVQCKLTIGAVDDPLEAEADAMADRVMRMPEHDFIQRKCAHCEAEEKIRKNHRHHLFKKNAPIARKKKRSAENHWYRLFKEKPHPAPGRQIMPLVQI